MKPDYREIFYRTYMLPPDESGGEVQLPDLVQRKPYLNKIIKTCFPENRDAVVLDLGCGYGALVYFAQNQGYRNVAGYDRSPSQVQTAKALGIEGVFEKDLFDAIEEVDAESVDMVTAFDVIEHMNKDELVSFITSINRVLKKGGELVVHTPNAESPFFGRIRYGDMTHELAFTQESLKQLLFACGFSRVSCFEDTPTVHGPKSAIRWVLWKVIRGLLGIYITAETGGGGKDGIYSQNLLAVAKK